MIQGKYTRTKEQREKHSKFMKEWYRTHEHPRGTLGKTPWNKGKKGLQVAWNKGIKGSIKPNQTSFKKGKENKNFGKDWSNMKGENHWNWKGGITPNIIKLRQSAKYQIWRNAVYLRDDFICQDCELRGVFLHAHHIKSFAKYPKLRFKIDNGLTLCKNCHAKLECEIRKRTALILEVKNEKNLF